MKTPTGPASNRFLALALHFVGRVQKYGPCIWSNSLRPNRRRRPTRTKNRLLLFQDFKINPSHGNRCTNKPYHGLMSIAIHTNRLTNRPYHGLTPVHYPALVYKPVPPPPTLHNHVRELSVHPLLWSDWRNAPDQTPLPIGLWQGLGPLH
jgi:hypothetical protein